MVVGQARWGGAVVVGRCIVGGGRWGGKGGVCVGGVGTVPVAGSGVLRLSETSGTPNQRRLRHSNYESTRKETAARASPTHLRTQHARANNLRARPGADLPAFSSGMSSFNMCGICGRICGTLTHRVFHKTFAARRETDARPRGRPTFRLFRVVISS